MPQCIAEMYAARLHNLKSGLKTQRIFGAVTFGVLWRFLELRENLVLVDGDTYSTDNIGKLLGALQAIIDLS